MRAFHFKAEYQKLLTPEVVAYLTQIHEYKGQQNLFIEAKTDALSNLLEVAKIQSTEASNRIEGIITTDDRLKKIVREKTMPQSRSEKEIAGYRDVLATIHESHDYAWIRFLLLLILQIIAKSEHCQTQWSEPEKNFAKSCRIERKSMRNYFELMRRKLQRESLRWKNRNKSHFRFGCA